MRNVGERKMDVNTNEACGKRKIEGKTNED
jgi:hypothetical protein